jgi:hypothetical protein
MHLMNRITRTAVMVLALAISLSPPALADAPDINSVVVKPRLFNDCPGSVFSFTNNYPSLLSMTDTNQNCVGFANLHTWRLSTDAVNPAEFENVEAFRFCADLTITGTGEAEAGLQIAPWWSESDGRLNVKTTTGEIAAFGGRLPFYSFSDPAGYNMHYDKGETIRLEIIYRPNALTEQNPATIEYIVDGNSSGQLPFDMGNPDEDPPHGLWGILTPSQVGGYFQFFLDQSGPTGSVTVTWENICYEALENVLFACPRGIGFWRQQCAQKGNGSTKICEEGLASLWNCLIDRTDIEEWHGSDGTVTTVTLEGMNDADLSSELCEQLQNFRGMSQLDRAEQQYLVLQLNICIGALSDQIEVSNGFTGTIGAAIDSLEAAMNNDGDVSHWSQVIANINDNLNLDAEECPEAGQLFGSVEPCPADTNGHGHGHGDDDDDDDGDDDDDDGDDDDDDGKGDNGQGHGRGDGNDRGNHAGRIDIQAVANPNPVVSGSSTISFQVPEGAGASAVDIAVYDLSGRLVRQLASGEREAGAHSVEWDLRDDSGDGVPAGIYFYRVVVGDSRETRKLMVVR